MQCVSSNGAEAPLVGGEWTNVKPRRCHARARAPPGASAKVVASFSVHAFTPKVRAEGVVAIDGRFRCSRRLIESAEVDMLIKLLIRVVVAMVVLAALA